MNKLLLATLLCGMFSSCTENMSGHRTTEESDDLPIYVEGFNFQGHDYLKYLKGGLIHSESCKCKEAKL